MERELDALAADDTGKGSRLMGIPTDKLKKRWMKEPSFKDGYDSLEAEFEVASMLIEARTKAKLSQQELAKKMGTSQSTIARLESGTSKPTLSTLERFAKATGTRVRLSLEPAVLRKKVGKAPPLARRSVLTHGSARRARRATTPVRRSAP